MGKTIFRCVGDMRISGFVNLAQGRSRAQFKVPLRAFSAPALPIGLVQRMPSYAKACALSRTSRFRRGHDLSISQLLTSSTKVTFHAKRPTALEADCTTPLQIGLVGAEDFDTNGRP